LLAKREERRGLDGIEVVLSEAVLWFNRITSSLVERKIERRKKERKKRKDSKTEYIRSIRLGHKSEIGQVSKNVDIRPEQGKSG